MSPKLPQASRYDRSGLFAEIKRRFALNWAGYHRANHWGRVRRYALTIVQVRGAEYARALQRRFYDLSAKAISHLTHAIRHHSDGEVSTDVTIQSCWDADRLDLGHVGIKPAAEFLSLYGAPHIESAYLWSTTHTPLKRKIKPISLRYATAEDYRKAVCQVGTLYRASDQQRRTARTEKISDSGSSLDPPPGSNIA